ncbi:MAG: metal ABC transporter solute-binding protein, Zn/Mn family [Lachnospirales bacterium]
MRKFIIILVFIFLTACNVNENLQTKTIDTEEKIVVYTTIYPLEYILNYLLGDKGDVATILPSGSDAHNYEPTQKQLIDIYESNMFVYLGLGLEAAAVDINLAMDGSKTKSLEVGKYLDMENINKDAHGDHSHGNHHIWIDPMNMIYMGEVVKDSIIETFPQLEENVTMNFKNFETDMKNLDKEYTNRLNTSLKRDTFIVSHDAFAHYEKYNIFSLPVKDESHSKDPTQKEMEKLIEEGKAKDIKTVFYEANIPCLPLDVIKDELNAKKETLDNLSIRTEIEVENNADYIEKSIRNIEVLEKALNE